MNLVQNHKFVGIYFTKLKILYKELSKYRPACPCSCGGSKELLNFMQNEYVMKFLMRLNDSFTTVRGQMLPMDHLPPINKVFAMVCQDEKQRSVSADTFACQYQSSSVAMDVNDPRKANNNKKDRPICTNSKMTSHTIDKSYKLHGFPTCYKPK